MGSERRPTYWTHVIIAMMILVIYLGTYAAIVRKSRLADPYLRAINDPIYTDRSPAESSLNENLSIFFWPAHCIDCWLRPGYWK